ncbi:MFS transporter OS=Streptomyces fumanus OX=67302 GN=GCM10018772_31420 PE=4 SV=1 [Streptomyces fumanus]
MERNPLFYDDTLNSANYHEWLKRWAVHSAVVPDKDEPDGDGGERERELVQRGLPYLKQVWGDANWQLFEVVEPTPLAEPNAVVQRADQGEWTLQVRRAGRILVRIPYSPWLSIVDAEGRSLEPPRETEASRTGGGRGEVVRERERLPDGDGGGRGRRPVDGAAGTEGGYVPAGGAVPVPRGTPCPEEWREER